VAVHVDSLGDVAGILEHLCRSRGAASSGSAAAITMNFIVYVDDPAHRTWVLERAERIAEKHPSRTIVLDATDTAAGVEIDCTVRETASGTILCERLALGIAALDAAAIAATTHQLTIAGIPSVLWWSGARLLESPAFAALAKIADAVVIDSSGSAHDEATLRDLSVFLEQHPDIVLHDLAFLRLAPWREMIAQFFDDPSLRENLFALRSLEIESGSPSEALYLGAWLGSRISWEALDPQTFRARDGTRVRFTREQRGDKRRVLRVRLTSDGVAYVAALSGDDENVVLLSVEEGATSTSSRLVPLHAIDNASLIEGAILAFGRDRIFDSSFETLRGLLA
jgi:glucose-6-phosphate dehydrogenase assembly protein OpcA